MIYFDGAASSPIYEKVMQKMHEVLQQHFANPSSIHRQGIESKKILDYCREEIAGMLQCTTSEVFFLSGATEANNWAIHSLWKKCHGRSKVIFYDPTSHASVIEPLKALECEGAVLIPLKIDREGCLIEAQDSLNQVHAGFCVLNWVNNETGVRQPLPRWVRSLKKLQKNLLVHVDAVQAFTKIEDCTFDSSFDTMSLSAHKINGPKGSGILMIRDELNLRPLIHGGGQERGLRGGTENVAGIAGMTLAARESIRTMMESIAEKKNFQKEIEKTVREVFPQTVIHGSETTRSPFISYFSIPPLPGEVIVRFMEQEGVCISTGSACHANSKKRSHVLKAMGTDERLIQSSFRISFHHLLKDSEFEEGKKCISSALKKIKQDLTVT